MKTELSARGRVKVKVKGQGGSTSEPCGRGASCQPSGPEGLFLGFEAGERSVLNDGLGEGRGQQARLWGQGWVHVGDAARRER